MSKRADLSPLGWFVVFLLYCAQAYIFMMFLVEHTGNTLWYWIGIVVYTMLFVTAVCVASDLNGRARKDEDVSKVWCIWLNVYSFSWLDIFQSDQKIGNISLA